ncbi:hypothetical protein [Roseovarius salis]|uniref:hypothetical protein n=1 Tax=Roseovarius salis TaxID=3376063 RepID=UPI0037CACE03
MSSCPISTVHRRRVFYVPGYDPIHPRRYRELYRKEAAEQARISAYDIDIKSKHGGGRYGWNVTADIEGAQVRAEFEVLVWSDIVRDSMEQGILGTYVQLVRTAWVYIASGALFRLGGLRKGPVIAALYPVAFLLAQLAIALLLAWVLGRFLALLHPWLAWAGLAMVPPVLEWFRRRDNKFFAYYLMHDYAYSARHRGAEPPELRARMAEFADEIAAALETDVDEVLVVGHSSGAHLAVSVLADVIRDGRVRKDGPVLSFLSLGQVVPMVSFLPGAHRLRGDLAYLCTRQELTWVDVTAPGDGCAFALCDPVAVSGVAPETGKRWPLVLSAAFTRTLSQARWRALRWRFFRLHFQYLCAFDQPGDYDYFRITAGPKTLGQRFAERAPSPSRIERPAAGYTGVAP